MANPRLSRAELAEFLPNLKLIKAFESLTADTAQAGEDTGANTVAIAELRSDADAAATAVAIAMAEASAVRVLAAEAYAEALSGQVAQLREELASVRSGVAALEQGYQL